MFHFVAAAERGEYCYNEVFQPRCKGNDVIHVINARRGRMRSGRCIVTNYKIGCYSDVTDAVRGICSGRQTCHIYGEDNRVESSCRGDLFTYLEVEYECVKGKLVTALTQILFEKNYMAFHHKYRII